MESRPSQTYRCHNEGCRTPGRTFQEAPEEWFLEKGRPTPRNCPGCRRWKEEQKTDGFESTCCVSCGEPIRATSGRRIMFHKKDGAWIKRTKCQKCTSDPEWARKQKSRRRGRTSREERASKTPRTTRPVLTCEQDPNRYRDIIHKRHGITAEDHIFYGSKPEGKIGPHKWREVGVMSPREAVIVAIQIAGRTDDGVRCSKVGDKIIKEVEKEGVIFRLIWEQEIGIVTCYPDI